VIPETTRMIEIRDASAGWRVRATDIRSASPSRVPWSDGPSSGIGARSASMAAFAASSSAQTEASSRSPPSPGPIRPANTARSPGARPIPGRNASRRAASNPAPTARNRTSSNTECTTSPLAAIARIVSDLRRACKPDPPGAGREGRW
jgi:hypothetical protein